MRVDFKASNKVKYRSAVKKGAVFNKLATTSPAKVRQYVGGRVTDLSSARDMIADLAIIVGQLAKETHKDASR